MTFFMQLGIEVHKIFPSNFFTTSSHFWEVIASVSIGNSTSRVRSIIQKGSTRQHSHSSDNDSDRDYSSKNGAKVIDREMIF